MCYVGTGVPINTVLYYNLSDPSHAFREWKLCKTVNKPQQGQGARDPTNPRVIRLTLENSVPLRQFHPFWWNPEDPKGPAQSPAQGLPAKTAIGSSNAVHIPLIEPRALAPKCSPEDGKLILLYLPRGAALCASIDQCENSAKVSKHL